MDDVAVEKKAIYTVPQSFTERMRLREIIAGSVGGYSLTPPLSVRDLSELSERLIKENHLDGRLKGWLMVEIHNCVWKETVASIPYEKRILLLPQCLSNSAGCKAQIDELGLLCYRCGSCSIPDLQDKAESLGMISIVAEGFTSVIELIESGVVEAVIGVGCLDSLEKAFPLLINHAVPGMAIPLNLSGCKDTQVDTSYVDDLMCMYSPERKWMLDYESISTNIKEWFSDEPLAEILGANGDATAAIACEWLSGDGKRWRPFLLVSTYMALTGEATIPDEVRLAAIAVECFHKASLVHDDIQDNDGFRYGKQTVHSVYGVPVAINVGDILLGEGYRILSMCNNMELMRTAAEAHIRLCRGQGMELLWTRKPQELTMDYVLEISRNKTVPAFEVALVFGVICAGGNQWMRRLLHDYSEALGIAYQLNDDLKDFEEDVPGSLRPSAVLAALSEQNERNGDQKPFEKEAIQQAIERVGKMAEDYRQRAIDSLKSLDIMEMKRLLFRVTERILKH
jgi:geranylgeranyl pyrophosphate synthase